MYEKLSDKLISVEKFLWRMIKHAATVLTILAISILIGAGGFMLFEDRGFEDAVLHSTYILSGFGLIELPTSYAGKLFAGFFGLYASLFFVAVFSMLFAPVVHRIIHQLQMDNIDSTTNGTGTNTSSPTR